MLVLGSITKTSLVKRVRDVLCKPSGCVQYCTSALGPMSAPYRPYYGLPVRDHISNSNLRYRFDNEIQSGLQISHAAVPDRGNTDETDYSRDASLDVCMRGPTAVSTLAGFINALQRACRNVRYGHSLLC